MIRNAEHKDLSKIVGLCKEGHEESVITTAPIDVKILRKNVQVCILSAEHLVLVVDLEDEIRGIIIGVTHQLWYSRKKQATDLFFYVSRSVRKDGWGTKLMRRFISWSKENPGVKEIMLGISSGLDDVDRTKTLYEHMGAIRIGENYVIPQE
jgi:GNAT superfamily N-acetyltransferase|tara:strand:+ start:1038 stop:1493 length:456 start_codon:yes stop_codon:yes gene_type:complete